VAREAGEGGTPDAGGKDEWSDLKMFFARLFFCLYDVLKGKSDA
jgi:hypothetical protein